jgi:hypothetical protein
MLVIRVRWNPSRPVTFFTLLRLFWVGTAARGIARVALGPYSRFCTQAEMRALLEMFCLPIAGLAFGMSVSFTPPAHIWLLCYSSGSFTDFTILKGPGFENASSVIPDPEASSCHSLSRFFSEGDNGLPSEPRK